MRRFWLAIVLACLALFVPASLPHGDRVPLYGGPVTLEAQYQQTRLFTLNPTTGALEPAVTGYLKANITSLTTTTVKTGAGYLYSLTVNTKGATASTATIYDNTAGSGTKIGTVDVTANVGTLLYNVQFTTGLTIVTATGTAGDLTVAYR